MATGKDVNTGQQVIPDQDMELIKKYNPKIWRRFLTMLVKTKDEIENIINKKGT